MGVGLGADLSGSKWVILLECGFVWYATSSQSYLLFNCLGPCRRSCSYVSSERDGSDSVMRKGRGKNLPNYESKSCD